MNNILPPPTFQSYGPNTIYGRYRFDKDDAFLVELQKHYPQPHIHWDSYNSWYDWDTAHQAWTLSRYDKYTLSSEFDTNILEVQAEEVYALIRLHIDSFICNTNGVVEFWFVGFDIKQLIMVHENHNSVKSVLDITLAVAYYPDPE